MHKNEEDRANPGSSRENSGSRPVGAGPPSHFSGQSGEPRSTSASSDSCTCARCVPPVSCAHCLYQHFAHEQTRTSHTGYGAQAVPSQVTGPGPYGTSIAQPPYSEIIEPAKVVVGFEAMLTPLNGLTGGASGKSVVEFLFRRTNKIVVLQWEPFSGRMGASGIARLSLQQTLFNRPPYEIEQTIMLTVKGIRRIGWVRVPAYNNPEPTHLYFYLSTDPSELTFEDAVEIPAGTVTWIVRH